MPHALKGAMVAVWTFSPAGGASRRERVIAATGAAVLQALLIYVLVIGLAVGVPPVVRDDLKLFGVTLPPPPPVEKPHPKQAAKHRPDGAAAPPNLRAKPAEIVAPPPPIVRPPPQVVVAAPVAGTGSQSSAGAANVVGPGTGAGGVGNGLGSGDGGNGDGDGDGTPARLRSGRIKDSDYPRSAYEAGFSGTVYTVMTIGTNGRVTNCKVARSSGNTDIDATTCRVILERFRFEPARDASGKPVVDEIDGQHDWST
ncbi:MAG: energy transducer TonB, partial [Sphingomonas sp.]